MKRIAAFILLLGFAGQTFSQGLTLLNFYINQNYIAAKQCENRYKPMLHCNGKCVLAKKLKQQEKKEQQNPEKKLQNKSEVNSSKSFFTTVINSILPLYTPYTVLSENDTKDRPSTIFHPPCN